MRVYKETDLNSFDFWSGAVDTVKYLTSSELETIEGILEELYPDGVSETVINDFFWFEVDTIADWLGYNSFEDIIERG